ncbi:CRISPR-associated protein Cas8c/Csd1 [Fibrobacteres bacterium R8-0-B4]
MILQSLKEYYDRKALDPQSGIAPPGWCVKGISFIIVLDEKGALVSIKDMRDGEGKKKVAKDCIVPQAVKKTSGIAANLLWDTAGYVLGVDLKKPKKQEEQKRAFIDKIKELGEVDDLKPVITFLETDNSEKLQAEQHYHELVEDNAVVSFSYCDDNGLLVCQRPSVAKAINKTVGKKSNASICLVSGEPDETARLHPSIKGLYGAQTSGANIVSFNLPAFGSYNKEQGGNAPVGENSAFAYTTALNLLLRKDSSQKFLLGGDTLVFWSAKETSIESDFASWFEEPPKDDPDAKTYKIKALLKSVEGGAYTGADGKEFFYILGLSPNAARISIRLWRRETVGSFALNIARYFKDMSIIKHSNEPEYYSLWRVLVNIAIQDKSENIPPNIAGDMMTAIIAGTPFPASVLMAAIRRIKSDQGRVKPVRAALIKACLNRSRLNINNKELGMSLDVTLPVVGYQLGRLFAALEKIQQEGLGDTNTAIRERYYGAASTSPATVFPILMRMKQHHIAKIERKGRRVNLEKLFAEIISRIKVNALVAFPRHLDINAQGYFAIGYYHQMQDFYIKHDTKTAPETEAVTE